MRSFMIQFSNVDSVAEFVRLIERNEIIGELNLGSFCLDPGSMMGILSADLRNVFCLSVYEDYAELVERLFSEYIVA